MPYKNMIISSKSQSQKALFIRKIVSNYKYWLAGFFTEEIRENGARIGFAVQPIGGEKTLFASKKIISKESFNKYGVNLEAFENTAVNALREGLALNKILVIDEIGAMTLASGVFMNSVTESLLSESPVLVTMRPGTKVFCGTFSRMEGTKMIELSEKNRLKIEKEVEEWLESWIKRIRKPRQGEND
ncbi:MAG: hypothetical protein HY746_02865 [Elusimicrobia bacterium]|nr:hypothetical protein [Elusimicrobiota bacterium]